MPDHRQAYPDRPERKPTAAQVDRVRARHQEARRVRGPEPDQGVAPAVGQTWEHHSTGRYTIYEVHSNGSISIRPAHHTDRGQAPDGGVYGARVWADYFLGNFRLVSREALNGGEACSRP